MLIVNEREGRPPLQMHDLRGGTHLCTVYQLVVKEHDAEWVSCKLVNEHGNDSVVYRAVEPDSLIANFRHCSRCANWLFISLIIQPGTIKRIRPLQAAEWQKCQTVPENRDRGIWLNGTVKKEIVAVFMKDWTWPCLRRRCPSTQRGSASHWIYSTS